MASTATSLFIAIGSLSLIGSCTCLPKSHTETTTAAVLGNSSGDCFKVKKNGKEYCAPQPNLKVALIGDQGLGKNAEAVLELIKKERAHVVLHQGDFDYEHNPDAWDKMITDVLGADFPYYASLGNHDLQMWQQYQSKLVARQKRMGKEQQCAGAMAIKTTCSFRGLYFVLSGAGVIAENHETYLDRALSARDAVWKLCSWHLNQSDMQAGHKGNQAGWGVFRTCQKHGALIVNGHEHSYSRTLTLNDVGNAATHHGAHGKPGRIDLAPGKTAVIVSGLAGLSKRAYNPAHEGQRWWASIFAGGKAMRNGQPIKARYNYGALFITFHTNGDPFRAFGYFKTIDGQIIDSFDLYASPN